MYGGNGRSVIMNEGNIVEVLLTATNNLYQLRAVGGYVVIGDKLTFGKDGRVRKAELDDEVIGVAVNTMYPEGCLFIWDEVEL